jgi:hypothetical protein
LTGDKQPDGVGTDVNDCNDPGLGHAGALPSGRVLASNVPQGGVGLLERGVPDTKSGYWLC